MAESAKKTTKSAAAAKPKTAAKPKAATAPKTKPAVAKTAAPKAAAPKAESKPKVVRERKPRAEGAEPSRKSTRKLREGMVVSNKMEKTVVVLIERRTQHPIYGKVVIRSTKFKAHDEQGCDVGDRVEIMETRPMSRDKRWRVTQILEKVK